MSVGYEIAKILNSKVVWHLRGFMDLDFGWMPLRGWDKYINTLKANRCCNWYHQDRA